MLSKTSIGVAYSIGEVLANRRIELVPAAESVLTTLTSYSTQAIEAQGSVALGVTIQTKPLSELLEAGSTQEISGTVPHDDLIHQYSKMVGGLLGATQSTAQNVVTPMIKRVVECVNAKITESIKAGSSPLEIIQQRPDPIFDFPYLSELVGRYVRSVSTVPLRPLNLAVADHKAALLTGNSTVDQALGEFADRLGPERLAGVWNSLFGNGVHSTTAELFATRPEDTVLAFFFAARAMAEYPEGIQMGESEWANYSSGVMAAAGAWINRHLSLRADNLASGLMVLSCPSEAQPVGQIVVDSDVYLRWLEQGGTPELIFATAYTTRRFDPRVMLANAENLTKAWESVLGMYQNATASIRADAMIEGLREAVTAEITALNEDDLAVGRDVMHELLREHIRNVKPRQVENIWDLARKAVCRSIFSHTDIEAFLLSMEEQAKLMPDKDPRELALYASIDFIARWLADMIISKPSSAA